MHLYIQFNTVFGTFFTVQIDVLLFELARILFIKCWNLQAHQRGEQSLERILCCSLLHKSHIANYDSITNPFPMCIV